MEVSHNHFEIKETTIDQIQDALRTQKITCVELVTLFLERIEAFDKAGAKINSILTLNPAVLDIASELDRRVKKEGPLFGIPVLIKDNIETKDAMPTTAGSIALKDNYAQKDSWAVEKLREAGAIILGKTNMSEWAYFMSTDAPSGYSGLGGQVLNPYGPENFSAGSVGGSSSGSGASIAANFAVVAIGTETSGSILSPASANSIVGIKPTVGLISRSGIIPLSLSQDTAGPMARTVRDAVIALGVMAGVDSNDPVTENSHGKALIDYTKHLNLDGLKGARIGVDYSYLSGAGEERQEQRRLINEAIEKMKAQGAHIVEVEIPTVDMNPDVLFYEFKHQLNGYLEGTGESVKVKSLEDVIHFNEREGLVYNQILLIESQNKSVSLEDEAYFKQREYDVIHSRELGIDKVMKAHQLDALLFANNLGAALPAKAGYPSITVPAGYTNSGMPVGVTFTGMAYSEPRLIELAYSYEQHSLKRVPPSLESF